jgi:hypothetical protein
MDVAQAAQFGVGMAAMGAAGETGKHILGQKRGTVPAAFSRSRAGARPHTAGEAPAGDVPATGSGEHSGQGETGEVPAADVPVIGSGESSGQGAVPAADVPVTGSGESSGQGAVPAADVPVTGSGENVGQGAVPAADALSAAGHGGPAETPAGPGGADGTALADHTVAGGDAKAPSAGGDGQGPSAGGTGRIDALINQPSGHTSADPVPVQTVASHEVSSPRDSVSGATTAEPAGPGAQPRTSATTRTATSTGHDVSAPRAAEPHGASPATDVRGRPPTGETAGAERPATPGGGHATDQPGDGRSSARAGRPLPSAPAAPHGGTLTEVAGIAPTPGDGGRVGPADMASSGGGPATATPRPVGEPGPGTRTDPPAFDSGDRSSAAREVRPSRSADLDPDTRTPLLSAHDHAPTGLAAEHRPTGGEALHASEWAQLRESATAVRLQRERHPFGDASHVEVRRMTVTAGETTRTVTEFTVKLRYQADPAMTPGDIARAKSNILDAADLGYNHRYRLSDGSQPHLRVEFEEVPASATEQVVQLRPGDGMAPGERPDMLTLYADMDPVVTAHELGHHLDLLDEYVDPEAPGRDSLTAAGVHRDGSLMGSGFRSWADHTAVMDHHGNRIPADVGLRDRHLAHLEEFAGHPPRGEAAHRMPEETTHPHREATPKLPDHVRDLLNRRDEDGNPVFPAEGRNPLDHALLLDRTHAVFEGKVRPEELTREHVRYTEELTDAARKLYDTARDYSFRATDLRRLRELADVAGAAHDGAMPRADLLHDVAHETLGHPPTPREVEALAALADHLNNTMDGRRPFELSTDALHRAAADRLGAIPGPETTRRAVDQLTESRPVAHPGERSVPRMSSYDREKRKAIQALRDERARSRATRGRDLTPNELADARGQMRDHLSDVARGEKKKGPWRPYIRQSTRQGMERQYDKDGNLVDPNTGERIPKGRMDVGHKPGYEHADLIKQAKKMGLSDAQIAEIVQYGPAYRAELDIRNRSHQYEGGGGPSKFLEGVRKNSDGSITVKGLRISKDGTVVDAKTKKPIAKKNVSKHWQNEGRKAAVQAQKDAADTQQWLNEVAAKSNRTTREDKALNAQARANEAQRKANGSFILKSSQRDAQRKADELQKKADKARNDALPWYKRK